MPGMPRWVGNPSSLPKAEEAKPKAITLKTKK